LPAARAAGRQPNIVRLLADDIGSGELGSHGQKLIKTRHLDALAAKRPEL
jgi:arylsulfatase A